MDFYTLLLIISFLYASVGHGGASGYLALMAVYAFTPEVMKPTALMLNVLVSALAFVQFYRGGFFKWHLFWPFVVSSIPMAFIGGMYSINAKWYKIILGVLLLFAILRILGLGTNDNKPIKKVNIQLAVVIGAVIGLFSGLIGIGGGIILSPIIVLLGWGNLKETAAVSALFIFVNSVSGLLGLQTQGIVWDNQMSAMIGIAIVGGLAGSYYGVNKFKLLIVKNILAFVLLIASIKLILT